MLVYQCDADEKILIGPNSKESLVAKILMRYYLLPITAEEEALTSIVDK